MMTADSDRKIRLTSVVSWVAFLAISLMAGLYAKPAVLPGMREGSRLAPRLPAPPTDVRVLLHQLGVGSVTWYAIIVALPLLVWGARRLDFERQRVRAIAIAALVILTLVVTTGAIDYLMTFPGGDFVRPPVFSYVPMAMRQSFLPWIAIAGVVAVFEARRRSRVASIERERLRAEAAEHRLVALTGQLQPHFLFNTLQGISTLIHRDPAAADAMLTKLSDLLREVLRQRDRTRVALEDELRYARTFLEIAQLRFGNRLTFSIDVPDELQRASVPLFILQPLVENALKHGVGAVIRGGRVAIRARGVGGRLHLDVIDDGPGFGSAPPVERLGLTNTRERLRAAFPTDHAITLTTPGDHAGSLVRIDIPHREEPLRVVAEDAWAR